MNNVHNFRSECTLTRPLRPPLDSIGETLAPHCGLRLSQQQHVEIRPSKESSVNEVLRHIGSSSQHLVNFRLWTTSSIQQETLTCIGVNPEGLGSRDPHILDWGSEGRSGVGGRERV